MSFKLNNITVAATGVTEQQHGLGPCIKNFTNVISFNPHQDPVKYHGHYMDEETERISDCQK